LKRQYQPLPTKRQVPKPLAMIHAGTGGIEIWSNWGTEVATPGANARALLRRYSEHKIFSRSKVNEIFVALDAQFCEASLWHNQVFNVKLDDGPKVIGTRGVFEDDNPADAFAALRILNDFCISNNVHLGSAGWTAEQFWRTGFSAPIGFVSPLGRRGLYGGRKELYDDSPTPNCLYVDIHSAYPSAMSGPFPTSLKLIDTTVPLTGDGIALATVTVPNEVGPPYPIFKPVPFGMWWKSGTHRGWYPFADLRNAKNSGCKIEIEAAYNGTGWYPGLFERWRALMIEGRNLPGNAGAMMKVVANSLWGIFGMSGSVKRVRFEDKYGKRIGETVGERKSPPPAAGFVGAMITGRVRERLWNELIPKSPLYVDTDGGVISARHGVPEPSGEAPGKWAVKHSMRTFYGVAPQAYRFIDWQDNETVVMAGNSNATRQTLERYSWTPADAVPGPIFKIRFQEPNVFDAEGFAITVDNLIQRDTIPEGWKVRQEALI